MFKKIKYAIQRIQRGYSDEDLWDFDDYLCTIIPPALRELKKNNTGCPSELWDKNKINNECHKWEEILEEIAQGFEAAQSIAGFESSKFVKDKEQPDYFIYETDKEKTKLLTRKYERGMDLFRKYFLNLWN